MNDSGKVAGDTAVQSGGVMPGEGARQSPSLPCRRVARCVWFAFAAVLLIAFATRFIYPELRPIHADEATQAYIFSDLLEKGNYRYDPHHFHGPLLYYLNLIPAKLAGVSGSAELPLWMLRVVPALAGVAAVAMVLASLRWASAAWRAGLLAAISPLLLYYSRMGIHEMLLAALALAVPLAARRYLVTRHWGWVVVLGLLLGGLHATKETWCIIAFSWLAACLLLWPRLLWREFRAALRGPLWLAALIALAVSYWLHSGSGKWPQGVVDSWRTLFLYKTGSGHSQPWWYYFSDILSFRPASGWLWGEGVAVLLALAAVVGALRTRLGGNHAFGNSARVPRQQMLAPFMRLRAAEPLACFLGLSAVVQVAIYTLIAYKMPWLLVVPVLYLMPFAGIGWAWLACGRCVSPKVEQEARGMAQLRGAKQERMLDCAIAAGVWLFVIAGSVAPSFLLNWVRPADARITLMYVPTLPEADAWLQQAVPALPEDAYVAVVAEDYWPLPWYFRGIEKRIGFFESAPSYIDTFDVVLSQGAADGGELLELRPNYYLHWREKSSVVSPEAGDEEVVKRGATAEQ